MLEGDGWSTPRPGRFVPGNDLVPTVQKVGWTSGPVRKISPPSGFVPRTVHPVTRSYTGPPLIDYKTINVRISTVNTESCSVLLVRSSVCVPHHGVYIPIIIPTRYTSFSNYLFLHNTVHVEQILIPAASNR
jgi:hypothetical protein